MHHIFKFFWFVLIDLFANDFFLLNELMLHLREAHVWQSETVQIQLPIQSDINLS